MNRSRFTASLRHSRLAWLILTLIFCVLLPANSRARYLNPNTGRFWSMDSFEGDNEDPGTLHKYLYVNSNPVNYADPTGMASPTPLRFGTAVEQVIRKDFVDEGRAKGLTRGGNQMIGTLIGKPNTIPSLTGKPDLYQLETGGGFFYEIKSATPRQIFLGFAKVAAYNSILNQYGSWRPGGASDYYFWGGTPGPLIKTDVNGSPLPGGQWAIVWPPVGGLITYTRIDPKLPKFILRFIIASAFAEAGVQAGVATESIATTVATGTFAAEAGLGVTTATATSFAGEAITVQALQAARLTVTLSSFATTATATTSIGTATMTGVTAATAGAAGNAMLGAP